MGYWAKNFTSQRAGTDHKKREIIMGNVKLKLLDQILSGNRFKGMSILLKARCETVVKMPTHSGGLNSG